MWFLPKWIEAIWEVFSKIAKLVWLALAAGWLPIFGTITAVAYLWGKIISVGSFIATQATVVWTMLTDSSNSASAALAGGWPSGMANGIGFLNSFLPVVEGALMVTSLIFVYLACTLVRMVKSWLPTVSS